MVVKIQPPSQSVLRVLSYNDRKVETGTCECIALYNTGTTSLERSYDVLQRYERGSRRTRNTVFHATVNPSATDAMDRTRALAFIRDLMSQLGYSRQPMVIYEHNDTGRRHYHIVSVRVDSEGYKINDLYENYRCQDICLSLESKYSFKMGKDPSNERTPMEYDLTLDLAGRIEKALRYRCTSVQQLRTVLQTLGVKTLDSPSGAVSYQILDPHTGKAKSAPVDANDLMIPSSEEIDKILSKNRYSNDDTFRRKVRLNGCVKAAMNGTTSEQELRRKLVPKGIDVVFSRTDEGRIFGVTFVDHTTRCVFKGSELEKGLCAKDFVALFSSEDSGTSGMQDNDTKKQQSGIGQDIAIAAVQAAATAGMYGEHDIPQKPRKRKRRRRIH